MIRKIWIGLWVAFAGLVALSPLVGAQDDDPEAGATPAVLRVEGVDARTDTWLATGVSSGGDPIVSADGQELPSEASSIATDVVVVLDNDRGLPNGNLQLAGNAAAEWLLPGIGPIRNVAVVSTAREGGAQEIGLSSSPDAVTDAIDGVVADGDAATWDALGRAADLLEGSNAPSKRIVAFLSAPDKLSMTNSGSAATALRLADAQLDVISLSAGVSTSELTDMVLETGGSMHLVDSDDEFAESAALVSQQIDSQFALRFDAPPGDAESVLLDFSAGDLTRSVQAERGEVSVGNTALEVHDSSVGLLDRLTGNSMARWLMIALIAAAVIVFIWSLLSMLLPDSDSLSRRLRAYDELPEDGDEVIEGSAGVATVPLLQRAVELTGEVAESRGFLESLEVSLERASLPLRAAEAVFFLSSAAFLVGAATFFFTGNLLVGVGALVLTIMVPKALLDMRVRSRQKAFVRQLPDMLALLAGTLKAGYSITQGFEAVSREVDDPMGKELRRVVTEHRLGRTLEGALDATAERMGSDDFAWTVMAIKIQREVGGNLAELLMTVANTMTQRERLRRDVNSLTAEGRMSAMILGILPPGLGMVMYFMNREYILDLFTPGLGYVMIGAAVIAMIVGFIWMKKIITIEV